MDIETYMRDLGKRARAASRLVAKANANAKNKALTLTAAAIERDRTRLLEANAKDVAAARAAKLDSAAIDRLTLTDKTIAAMADGLRQIAGLPDPVGEISELKERPTGIKVGRMRVPLGVIAIIYESRPNVTADAAGLCLKSGNACILRGGSESIHSNQAIALCVQEGLRGAGLPEDAVQVVSTTDRAAVGVMLRMNEYIDIVVPRGGKSLIERVMSESRIPMIKHLDGICHVYIDDKADFDKAIRIADNAKTQRYGTCNTMETLLLSENTSPRVLRELLKIYRDKSVELRVCAATRALLARAGVSPGTGDLEDVGFAVAPRLNAAGRVGEAMDAARLLLADGPGEAATLAARVKTALVDYGTAPINLIALDNELDLFEPDTELFRVLLQFTVSHIE